MAFAPTPMQVQCPNCGTRSVAQVFNIVDAAEQPELKEALLTGELNTFACPACGAMGAVQAPILYHDPNKELFLLYVPMNVNLSSADEERFIAEMTNAVIRATPPAQQKGYLLRPPTRVISMQGLAEQILEADGISRDAIREQTELIKLLATMAEYVDDDEQLKQLVSDNKERVGYQLLLLLAATIEAAAQQGDETNVTRYTTLREKLIEFADLSPDQIPTSSADATYEQALEMLRNLAPDQLRGAVAANRPLLDYGFFLHLTNQLEQASGEERQALEGLRTRLVELTEEMDEEAKVAVERASAQLSAILKADDLEAAVRERIDELDEAFLVVLSANLQAAQEQKRQDIVEVLTAVYRLVVGLLQERLRPELTIVNQLLQSEDPAEHRRLIEEALGTYNPPGFLELIETIAEDVEAQGGGDELLARLHQIADEVRAAISRPPEGRQAARTQGGVILTPGQERPRGDGTPKIYIPGRDD